MKVSEYHYPVSSLASKKSVEVWESAAANGRPSHDVNLVALEYTTHNFADQIGIYILFLYLTNVLVFGHNELWRPFAAFFMGNKMRQSGHYRTHNTRGTILAVAHQVMRNS